MYSPIRCRYERSTADSNKCCRPYLSSQLLEHIFLNSFNINYIEFERANSTSYYQVEKPSFCKILRSRKAAKENLSNLKQNNYREILSVKPEIGHNSLKRRTLATNSAHSKTRTLQSIFTVHFAKILMFIIIHQSVCGCLTAYRTNSCTVDKKQPGESQEIRATQLRSLFNHQK